MTKFGDHIVREGLIKGAKAEYLADQLVVKLKGSWVKDTGARQKVMDRLPEGTRVESSFNRMGIGVFRLPEGADSLRVASELQEQEAEFVDYAQAGVLHRNQQK
ncbi:MAG: hypothetical protein JST93_11945 [Acidobacteria bacterium]|nr:hypothetical protein [Acidobacteriota bacterium]